jgi:3-oxoacyl-[acyl-carrier-protein] synthase-3
MKIGIKDIQFYIPSKKINNISFSKKFNINERFLKNKIGFLKLSKIGKNQKTSDLAIKSIIKTFKKFPNLKKKLDCILLVTQTPDLNIPHTSSIIHKKIGLKSNCVVFDVSLGCSGYVHGLSILKSFMILNKFKNGLLVTADPYSKIIDENDKDTCMIFGDASSSTLISSENPVYEIKSFDFGTQSESNNSLVINTNGYLKMNGREIFNFVKYNIPKSINNVLKKEGKKLNQIDYFVFHQGSKFVLDSLRIILNIELDKVIFDSKNYGNTVSSSIPIILSNNRFLNSKYIICSGFGVGLSWASTLLKKI